MTMTLLSLLMWINANASRSVGQAPPFQSFGLFYIIFMLSQFCCC